MKRFWISKKKVGQHIVYESKPLHWAQIATVAVLSGTMKDFSKGECFKMNKFLKKHRRMPSTR